MQKLIPYNRIMDAAKKNGAAINKRHEKTQKPIVLLGVLGGSVMWLSEIMKHVTVPCEVDFVKVSSYRNNKQGHLKWLLKPQLDLQGKTVIIVEDIVDTGVTIREISDHLLNKCRVQNIEVCTMLAREGAMAMPTYLGYLIPEDAYVIGFGLDDNELKRCSKDIYSKKIANV